MHTAGAIDIGSNAIRMAIGRLNDKGKLVVIENCREAIRVGQEVFTDRTISEHTTRLVAEAFQKFQRYFADHQVDAIRAVGTSALREADNQDYFTKQLRTMTGISVEIIRGEEEAELIQLAVADRIELEDKLAILIDIGGGSIEVTLVKRGNIVHTESAPMGTVRLLKLLEDKKQPTRVLNRRIREYASGIKQQIAAELRNRKLNIAIGTGGNIECLGELRRILLGQKSEDAITLEELNQLVERLQSLSVEERISELGLKNDRADVIFPAAAVLQGIMQQANVAELVIPHVGLKEGLLLEQLSGVTARQGQNKRKQLCDFAHELGQKYQYQQQHSESVARLALELFDQTRELHRLDDDYRLLLELGATLHDVGQYISYDGHHRHSAYLIMASPIVGLREREQQVVAAIARYHRKAPPKMDHLEYARLDPADRQPVTALAAILRIADALDRQHASLVKNVKVDLRDKKVAISVSGNGDMVLERWAAKKKGKLFEDFFDRDIVIVE